LLIPSLRSKCASRRSRHPCSSLWPPNGSSSELPSPHRRLSRSQPFCNDD
jgi:hypothetical protein